MKEENTLSVEVLKKIDSIKKDRTIVRCTSTEIKDRLGLDVSKRYINVVLSGDYIGNYENEQILKIIDTAIEILEEKKHQITSINEV